MYDGAGEWLVSVGIPAKSGVSGGVLGVAVFSPPLDPQGNSVRGVAVCRDLSRDLALHLVRPGEQTAPPVRGLHTLREVRSRRVRSPDERAAINDAERTAVFELQGELSFLPAEAVSRAVTDRADPPDLVIVDMRRVVRTDRGGLEFLCSLASFLAARGGRLAVSGFEPELELERSGVLVFDTLDRALESCEQELLSRVGYVDAAGGIRLAEHGLLAGLDVDEIDTLLAGAVTLHADAGTMLIRAGEPASELFLIERGSLGVLTPGEGRVRHRLTTLTAGMAFGELAYVGGVRSADVVADTAITCQRVPYVFLDDLADGAPVLYGKLLRNILRVVAESIRLSNTEVSLSTR